jgi:formylglycine-generating enzyme required for sulfatase activity
MKNNKEFFMMKSTAFLLFAVFAVFAGTACGDDYSMGAAPEIEMVRIPAGSFTMGNPVHSVTLTRDFYMGVYPVTQEQYAMVMTGNANGVNASPSHFHGGADREPADGEVQAWRPVENMRWYEVIIFCNRLSILEGREPVYSIRDSTNPKNWGNVPTTNNATWDAVTANWDADGYRLPTDAEWEYACRAGTTTAWYTGNTEDAALQAAAWYGVNSGGRTREVGLKTPNAWGLYDMHGNVWEHVWNWFPANRYSSARTDPRGSESGTNRVVRGGGWGSPAGFLRSAFRSNNPPSYRIINLGFRVVRTACSGDYSMGIAPEIEMVKIPAGTFTMGQDEVFTPVHSVRLTGFYMGKYAVTQEQYEAVMGVNPSYFNGIPIEGDTWDRGTPSGEVQAKRPVETVTWFDAVEFCNKLSLLEGLNPVYTIRDITRHKGHITAATVTANWNVNGYRLPTEAEWEYACRAGTTTIWYTGDTEDDALLAAAWYFVNSGNMSRQVGLKTPNSWGLYDMHGNVFEWVWDWRGNYTVGAKTNPRGPTAGTHRVVRGGAWGFVAWSFRATRRYSDLPSHGDNSLGFRVVRNAQ